MKFLHTADIHLKDKATLDILRVLVETANGEKCSHMMICGDLFDKENSNLLTEQSIPGILESFRGEILILPGNHDLAFLSERKSLSSNSMVLNSPDYFLKKTIDGIDIIAVPYKDNLLLKDVGPIDCDPDHSILMIHGNYYTSDFFYGDDSKKYLPIFDEDLQDRYRYAAMGHYHKLIRKNIGRTIVVNPGSPRVTRASDIGPRIVSVVDTKTWAVEIKPLPVPYNELLELRVNVFDSSLEIRGKLSLVLKNLKGRQIQTLIVKISGMLSSSIEVKDLNALITEELKKVFQGEYRLDHEELKLLDSRLLENPFVINLLEELDKGAQSVEEKERLKYFALERLCATL